MKCVYLLDSLCAELIITPETPTATPVPTIVATPGSSTETPDQATPEMPIATPAPTIVVGDAGTNYDSGGRPWRLNSSRSTQTPALIATPAATPGSSTVTSAQATPETPSVTGTSICLFF
ncbi:hypothetical protein PR003_g27967 [Phytophthora rubi]|uniref:Uncharacterized protein n=1 Tax=Phytophthora rubi TaxID=129364 RepID=A0A6A4C3M5_9STRA|nr:hypothetical protein PR003_g27967 [Phytophthora rubi]